MQLRSARNHNSILWHYLIFLMLLFVSSIVVAVPTQDATKIQLQFSRLPTVQGQTIMFNKTHFSQQQVKHGDRDWQFREYEGHELAGKGRVIEWDETNQTAKLQFEVAKLSHGDMKRTNHLSLHLNPFTVQSVSGVAFARTQKGQVDTDARRILEDTTLVLFPFLGWVIDDEAIGTHVPRNVGETWIGNFGEGKNAERINKFTPVAKTVSTNAIFEVCFVGLTNYHQTECFRITASSLISTNSMPESQLKAYYFAGMKNLNYEGMLVFDKIVPFNRNLPVLFESVSATVRMSFEAPVDGTNAMVQLKGISETTIQRQPISGFDR